MPRLTASASSEAPCSKIRSADRPAHPGGGAAGPVPLPGDGPGPVPGHPLRRPPERRNRPQMHRRPPHRVRTLFNPGKLIDQVGGKPIR